MAQTNLLQRSEFKIPIPFRQTPCIVVVIVTAVAVVIVMALVDGKNIYLKYKNLLP